MSELTKVLNLHFTTCVLLLLFVATGISTCPPNTDCADSSSSEEIDDSGKVYSGYPRNRFKPGGNWKRDENSGPPNVWVVVGGVIAATVVTVVVGCCLYFLTYRKSFFQRSFAWRQQPQVNVAGAVPLTQINIAGAVPNPSAPPVAVFEEEQSRGSANNRRNEGQLGFSVGKHDESARNQIQSQPLIQEQKSETPPPEYSTVAPFK